MASPAQSSRTRRRLYSPRRRSASGAKQLTAAHSTRRRVLLVIGLLVVGLLVAIGTIAFHLVAGESGK